MSNDVEFRRATAEWLAAGSDRTPPVVIDAVLLAVRNDRQERDLPIPWSNRSMPNLMRAAALAAAIGVVAFAWWTFRPADSGIGRPQPSASPSATPSPSPTSTPVALVGGGTILLDPGRYRLFAAGTTDHPMDITITGEDWTSYANFAADKNGAEDPGISIVDWDITTRYADPCTDHTPIALPTGSPATFVEALGKQPKISAGPIHDVTIDGHTGKSIELTESVGPAECTNGFWAFGDGMGGRPGSGQGEIARVYAVDANGTQRTFFLRIPAGTSAADRAELEAVVDSIHIVP